MRREQRNRVRHLHDCDTPSDGFDRQIVDGQRGLQRALLQC